MTQYKLQVHRDAENEFDQFVNRNRATAYDVGNLFRVLEEIVEDGLADWFTPVHMESECRLYMFSCTRLSMFVASYGETLLLVHMSELGQEREQVLRTQAIDRMKQYFGI